LKSKQPDIVAFQKDYQAHRVQGQRWHEPDDKKYNPSRHETNQNHGHAEGCQIKP